MGAGAASGSSGSRSGPQKSRPTAWARGAASARPTTSPARRAHAASSSGREQVFGEHGVGPDAERDAELVAVEVGERARLRQHEVGDAALAGHDLLDPLVDGAGADQAVADHGAGLADAPRAVARLVLDRGVPPAVVEHDVARGGEVQPGAAGLQREHERARALAASGTRAIMRSRAVRDSPPW